MTAGRTPDGPCVGRLCGDEDALLSGRRAGPGQRLERKPPLGVASRFHLLNQAPGARLCLPPGQSQGILAPWAVL